MFEELKIRFFPFFIKERLFLIIGIGLISLDFALAAAFFLVINDPVNLTETLNLIDSVETIKNEP